MGFDDENKSLAELFSLESAVYSKVDISSLAFSVRVENRLKQLGIFNVCDLLEISTSRLLRIPGFGSKCLQQVNEYCQQLKNERRSGFEEVINAHRDKVCQGDFSFVEQWSFTKQEKQEIEKIIESREMLGSELVRECFYSPTKLAPVLSVLNDYYVRQENKRKIERLLSLIPEDRRHHSFKYYLDAYTYDELVRDAVVKCYGTDSAELDAILETLNYLDDFQMRIAIKFLEWCSFDLQRDVSKVFDKLYSEARVRFVIEGRANHQTLNEIGELLNVTRERVRQIEKKACRRFAIYISKGQIIQKIYAEQNGQSVITLEDIAVVCRNDFLSFVYLLKACDNLDCTYDSQIDAFVYGDSDLLTRIQNYLETLPDVISLAELPEILTNAQEIYSIDPEMVERAIRDSYRSTGDVLHRARLSLAQIYETILRKYYPEGIHATDDESLNAFRSRVKEEFGDVPLPPNNRAITARLTSVGILAGRGIYMPRRKDMLPIELANRILEYITNEPSTVIGLATVYSAFEEELQSVGIQNKYLLQSTLREIFGDKLFFRRDYISKDKEFTSIYSAVVGFIKESKYPIKREEIKQRFPGITDIVISIATGDTDVLNYFGEYLHGSRLVIRETEKKYLFNVISELIVDGEAHHIKEIYARIMKENRELLLRNAVIFPFSAFSMLEYLFREAFQFSRPFVARNDVEIGRPGERLHELLYCSEEIEISEISELSKELHFSIPSFIDFINAMNDKYLIVNNTTLKTIEMVGADTGVAGLLEENIYEIISGTEPIGNVIHKVELPKINVEWTEWLVYSVLQKWSMRLEVAISSNQFRASFPLVAKRGEMEKEQFSGFEPVTSRIHVDNMDDIDKLIEDIVVEEIQEGWNEF